MIKRKKIGNFKLKLDYNRLVLYIPTKIGTIVLEKSYAYEGNAKYAFEQIESVKDLRRNLSRYYHMWRFVTFIFD